MYGTLISKNLNSMAIIQTLGYKQRWRILFSKLPLNIFELYCREQRKQNVQIKPTILIEDATAPRMAGGFDWVFSTLGTDFWNRIAFHLIRKDKIDEELLCIINDSKKFIDFRKFR